MSEPAATPRWTPEALKRVRRPIRETLLAVPSFAQLAPEEQTKIANAMVKVFSYIEDPDGVMSETGAPLARAQEDANEATRQMLSKPPADTGQDFRAGAVREGTQAFGQLVQTVDFPKFVGGLINNVFRAIVETSIQQMRAYGDLIANVAKSVDQFAQDNITEGAGRDFLANRFPDAFSVQVSSEAGSFDESAGTPPPTARLVADGDNAEARLKEVSTEYNINPPVTDISDPQAELRLVTAARLQMARSRQQLLSSMVMLGINRIVVTDGSINAKVVFDMRASDTSTRKYTAQAYDEQSQRAKQTFNTGFSAWYSPASASFSSESEEDHMATVQSALDQSSASKAEVKAKLSGEVRVNFKSDYLPLEKMATPEMISAIQGNSAPGKSTAAPGAAAAPAPARAAT